MRNYRIYRNDRPNRRAGGTAILVHKSVQHTVLDNPALHRLESTAIGLNIGNKAMTIISIYNPPGDIDIDDLAELLQTSDSVLIMGDFNAKHTTWNCRQNNTAGRKLFNFYNESEEQFQILSPSEPTHIPDIPGQLMDVLDMAIAKNIPHRLMIDTLNELDSDHLPIKVTLMGQNNKAIERNTLNYNTANWQKFKDDIEQDINLGYPLDEKDIDTGVNMLTKAIQTAMSANIPKRKNQLKLQTYPQNIIDLIRQRNSARRQWQRHHTNRKYKREVNRLKFQIQTEMQTYISENWTSMLSQYDTRDMSAVWKLTKSITHTRTKVSPLDTDNGPVTSPNDKANTFANTLESTFTPHREQNAAFTLETEDIVRNFLKNPPKTEIRKTNIHELKWQIKHLPDRKAPGPDGIQNIVIKHLPEVAIEFMVRIINGIFLTKYYPKAWKEARILLFPKPKKNHRDPANYRPISLLNTMSKLAEKIISKRLNNSLKILGIIRNEQCGFRRGHSTTMQLMRHVENITRGYNQNRATVALYLDIQQAFDKVWHTGLIRKMIDYNIDDGLVCLISNYLSDRKFHTKWENELSNIKDINSGVAQGSIIGPTLFNIYINDIPHLSQHNNSAMHIFADDTLITGQSHRPENAVSQVQQTMALIEPWLEKWKIRINPQKCQAIIFSKKWAHIRERCTPIRINGCDISWSTEAKYLGIILDQKLLFKNQIQTSVNKAYGMLNRLFPIINYKSKLHYQVGLVIYKALLRSMVTYACPIWGQASKVHTKKIQIFQNKCLRLITHLPKFISIDILHRETRMETIQEFIESAAKKFYCSIKEHDNELIGNLGNYEPRNYKHKTPKSLFR